ncbi:MAG: DUF1501 domain-containing protein [Planctomycetes bacterium]|nr:DUF1501 domain-containing protein [Planctomycetota bacterium]
MAITRRDLLRIACATGVGVLVPSLAQASGAITAPDWTRSLILVELDGGNDGLNTVVPWQDATYLGRRGALAVQAADTLNLDSGPLRLNKALGSGWMSALWGNGELAIVRGVGMANPNRSHFRGIDIWNTGSDPGTVLGDGWLRRAYDATAVDQSTLTAHGVLLARPTSNPMGGNGMRVLSLSSPKAFRTEAAGLASPSAAVANPALQHILTVQRDVVDAKVDFDARLTTLPTFAAAFPTGRFGDQCRSVAQMITAGLPIPVYKLSLGGFDTHSAQRTKHDGLLAQLGQGLKALRDALAEKGVLDRALIVSYSEFGRRVEANDSGGTDHGTAAAHLVIGSTANVVGGWYGAQPSLTDLDARGDLKSQLDFRRLYATGLAFLGLPSAGVFSGTFAPVDGLLRP